MTERGETRQGAFTLEITRDFTAEPEAVFAALTEPEALAAWFGPPGVTVRNVIIDLRPGGRYSLEMHEADGEVFPLSGIYREIDPPRRLSFTWTWQSGVFAGQETLVTIELTARPPGTRLRLVHEALTSEASRDQHRQGWNGCFDCLVAHLGT